jgi:hypothetical protein
MVASSTSTTPGMPFIEHIGTIPITPKPDIIMRGRTFYDYRKHPRAPVPAGESGDSQLVQPKHQGYSRARATAELEGCHVKGAQERAAVLQQMGVLHSAVHSPPIEWEASVLMRSERECGSALSSLGHSILEANHVILEAQIRVDPFADSIPSTTKSVKDLRPTPDAIDDAERGLYSVEYSVMPDRGMHSLAYSVESSIGPVAESVLQRPKRKSPVSPSSEQALCRADEDTNSLEPRYLKKGFNGT